MSSSMRLGLRAIRQSLQSIKRRTYATLETPAIDAPVKESGFTRFYNSPVGPKTVHFWAPIMKWGVVLAGASDFARPASQLSITQNMALMATGSIWTRWCFVIKPRNLFLASVNFLLFCVGAAQTTRVLLYQQSLKGDSLGHEVETMAKEQGHKLVEVVKHPGKIVESVEKTK
ncbi:hypothetical protein LTR62_007789 [Meristemomyces frigidus]|uniref:Mitochondrial pyruvate carrier n=1 Tax=Meristemomyces frigidus TaxID=1508187 RepID=A0AAN7TBJ3_9PEZI|nr:hypothetical protein LTR62_007789 [Meristemomyces frigidus]